MKNSKIDHCINRINKLSPENKQPFTKATMVNVAKELGIVLPYDFKTLCSLHSYEFLGHFEFYNFSRGGVIKKTKGWRAGINLPNNYLVLADDGTSAVLMKIEEDNAIVIWCSLEDVYNICDNQPMEYDPTIFPTFTDFYEFLLDEEEKMRAEDAELTKAESEGK